MGVFSPEKASSLTGTFPAVDHVFVVRLGSAAGPQTAAVTPDRRRSGSISFKLQHCPAHLLESWGSALPPGTQLPPRCRWSWWCCTQFGLNQCGSWARWTHDWLMEDLGATGYHSPSFELLYVSSSISVYSRSLIYSAGTVQSSVAIVSDWNR